VASGDFELPDAVEDALERGNASGFFSAGGSKSNSFGTWHQPISYTDATDTYTFYATGDPSKAFTFTEQDAVQGAVHGYNYFKPRGVDVGASDVIAIYHDDSKARIDFSYTSFAFARLPGASPSVPLQAYVFGVPTASLPRIGSATYSGLVGGFATASNGANYTLEGTSTLNANFGSGQYSTSMTFFGRNADGTIGLANQTYSGLGPGSTFAGSPLYGNLSGSGTGTWNGRFFGPNAEEFGYAFNVKGSDYNAVGVAAGKKR
jgi:hypothetical protein